MSLKKLFTPRGVAVIGSTSEGKLGYELIGQLVRSGYSHVFAVNPRAQAVFGVAGFDSVTKIKDPVDLAVIVSPPSTVPGVLADCGRAGVQTAIIITAGFSEIGNTSGEQELKQVADQYGIRFLGPNCAGLVNTHYRLFPTLETPPPRGGVSLIAQSGAVGGVVLAWAKEYGLGIAKFVSYGNGADINEIELVRYLSQDPETHVVALYIESVTEGRAFMQAVRACTPHKPVVVIKAGRTASGRRATLSHTGSMAGADAVYDAALKQCGAIRVRSIEELFDLCKAFLYLPRIAGHRVAIVTNSGGPAVLAADRAEEMGLDVAEPKPRIGSRLSQFLPDYCALQNPFDLTAEGTESGYRETLKAVLTDYDAALALNIAPAYLNSLPLARGVCAAAESSTKPLVASFLPRQIVGEATTYLEERGIPNFATGERAVTALAHMAAYHCRKTDHAVPEIPEVRKALPTAKRLLEPEAMAWLEGNGIPVLNSRFAPDSESAVASCREIGYPVVMKVVSPQILHKSEFGGVILDIRDDRDATEAYRTLVEAASGKEFRGAIIYPMVKDAQEVLIGLSRDPQFGPVVLFGLGGIYTEIWSDVSLRVAPTNRAQAEAMIHEIHSFPLLRDVRGRPARDLDALANLIATVSQLPFIFPEIGELDLNPVFLFEKGLAVGDVRIIPASRKET